MISKKIKKDEIEQNSTNYWMSFTDLMTTLLILIIFVSLSLITTVKQKNEEAEKLIDTISYRTKIAKALSEEFKDDKAVIVDENTGVVTVNEDGVEFASYKSEMVKNSKNFLDDFFPRYVKTVLASDFEEYVKTIVIEGHTARPDTETLNGSMKLSLERAHRVWTYVLEEKVSPEISDDFLEVLKKRITPSGRGFLDLWPNEKNNVSPKHRRVEFHFQIDDIKIIQDHF